MINDGLSWLEQKLNQHCSSQVEYVRVGSDAVTVDAVFGKTEYEVEDENGFAAGAFASDFLIDAASLGIEPAVGDVIRANGKNHEVMRLPGQGCWRWTGPNQSTYRIHTREV